ncbi:hypothetical protein Hanom_Chr15g01378121 [Helianthus anomalus]
MYCSVVFKHNGEHVERPVIEDMLAETLVRDATMEFDMIVSLVWFPFRMYVLDGSTKFFRVEELIIWIARRDEFVCDVMII